MKRRREIRSVAERHSSSEDTLPLRALLDDMRQLRRDERAPQGLHQRVSERLQREHAADRLAGRRVGARSVAQLLAAAAVLGLVFAALPRLEGLGVSARREIAPGAEPGSGDAVRPAAGQNAPELHSLSIPYFEVTTLARAHGNDILIARARDQVRQGDPAGDSMWLVTYSRDLLRTPAVQPDYRVVPGELCSLVSGTQHLLGGWPWDASRSEPSSFELEAGQRYRLSLRASASGPLPVKLLIKVGHQKVGKNVAPQPAAVVAAVPVTPTRQLFTVDFEPQLADDEAGVAFVLSSTDASAGTAQSKVCLHEIALTRL